ncbi:hypothetical protein EVAR_11938_1 [Eumeta japonica]|uniref:Uncharacterized protein n=1 Tax=Eumeta variegata TaxID=151549 RepID=A0A4C1U515_EUMVA|nr:hypothetical protein EVAR_11938_1 [Eumeta japonica]
MKTNWRTTQTTSKTEVKCVLTILHNSLTTGGPYRPHSGKNCQKINVGRPISRFECEHTDVPQRARAAPSPLRRGSGPLRPATSVLRPATVFKPAPYTKLSSTDNHFRVMNEYIIDGAVDRASVRPRPASRRLAPGGLCFGVYIDDS